MRGLRQTIRAAQRRVFIARLVARVGEAMAWGAGGAVVLVGLERVTGAGIGWWWLVGCPLVAGLAAGVARAAVERPSELVAAGTLDDALFLKDRLTTGLTLRPGQDEAFTTLAVREAEAAGQQAQPRKAVRVRFGRTWAVWPALASAAIAGGLFLPALDLLGWERAKQTAVVEAARRQEVATRVERAIEDFARPPEFIEPAEAGVAQSQELAELERLREELETGKLNSEEATAKAVQELQSIAERAEERARMIDEQARARAETFEALQRGSGQARSSGAAGDASEEQNALARSIRQGDLAAARDAARELLKQGEMSEEQRRELAEEMERLAADLEELERQEQLAAEQQRADTERAGDDRSTGDRGADGKGGESTPAGEQAERDAQGDGRATGGQPPRQPAGPENVASQDQQSQQPEQQTPEKPAAGEARSERSQQGERDASKQSAGEKSAGKGTKQEPASGQSEQASGESASGGKGEQPSLNKQQGAAGEKQSSPTAGPSEQKTGEQRPQQSPSGEASKQGNEPSGEQDPTGNEPASGESLTSKDATQQRKPDQSAADRTQAKPGEGGEAAGKDQQPGGEQSQDPASDSVRGQQTQQSGAQQAGEGEPSREQPERDGMSPEDAQRLAERAAKAERAERGAEAARRERRELAERLRDAAKSMGERQESPKRQPSPQQGEQQDPEGNSQQEPGAQQQQQQQQQTGSEQPQHQPGEQSGAPPRSSERTVTPQGEQPSPDSKEGGQAERMPQPPTGAPSDIPPPTAEAVERLAKQLEKMASQGKQGELDRQRAAAAREQARRMAENLSPQQQERVREWAEALAKSRPGLAEQFARGGDGEEPRDPSGPPPAMSDGSTGEGRGGNTAAGDQPAENRSGDARPPLSPRRTEIVDARDPQSPRRAGESDQVVAEWLAPPTPGTGTGGAAAVERVRRAAQSAQQAVDDRAVPSRYDRLVQRYFRRLPDKVAERTGATPAQSVPAQDAP